MRLIYEWKDETSQTGVDVDRNVILKDIEVIGSIYGSFRILLTANPSLPIATISSTVPKGKFGADPTS